MSIFVTVADGMNEPEHRPYEFSLSITNEHGTRFFIFNPETSFYVLFECVCYEIYI